MKHLLQRHPFAVEAHFAHSLVLTYAFPKEVLEPLLPRALQLDTLGEFGFLAIAMVQTRGLRPAGWPAALGQNFFLAGYRLFVRFKTPTGRTLRGLYILRSEADRASMVCFGNLLTHYRYGLCRARVRAENGKLEIQTRSLRGGNAVDLHVVADLNEPAVLPAGSIFETAAQARRFAGPLPYTFDYEPETDSIVMIRGVRTNWLPSLVPVQVKANSYLRGEPFCRVEPILASAFYVHDIAYRWERGVRIPLKGVAA